MTRPTARRRGYSTQWERARAGYLAAHPWCVMCAAARQRTRATVVDHKVPHKGDMRLFWDQTNWQPLCETHHNSSKQREEKTGHAPGCNAAGLPLDPTHHWNGGEGRT